MRARVQSRACAVVVRAACCAGMRQASSELPHALRPVLAADAVRVKAGSDYSRAIGNRTAWVKATEGRLFVCGTELRAGEGLLLERETVLAAYADVDSLLLIIEFEEGAS